MVLVDSSVWIAHFRHTHPELVELLTGGLVLTHPFVCGELACGNIKNRTTVLSHLSALPEAKMAAHEEVLRLLKERRLFGLGLGWIDLHLLASGLLSECQLWTLDKRLAQAATELGLS
jgi:predicted nucleic acid-binding protein